MKYLEQTEWKKRPECLKCVTHLVRHLQMRYLPRFSRGSNIRFLFPYKQSSNQEEHFFNALSMFLKLIFLGPPRKTGHAWKHHRYDAIDVTYVDVCWLLPRTGNGMSNLLKLVFDDERDGKKIEWMIIQHLDERLFLARWAFWHCPTEHLKILKPKNDSMNLSELRKMSIGWLWGS